jgi:prepilin-type N-terminal cleavage/methylation domain-containing protein
MKTRGFTLLEMLLVIFLVACGAVLVAMNLNKGLKDSQGRACAADLEQIQAAKDQFRNDNPGVALTSVSQLAKYLPNGIPACPAGGTYNNVLNLDSQVTCSLDQGQPGLHNLLQPTAATPKQ